MLVRLSSLSTTPSTSKVSFLDIYLPKSLVLLVAFLSLGSITSLGKAPLADLKSGIATAPTLFAAEQFPQLLPIILRKFESPGDVEEALDLVQRSDGLARCRRLAQVHAERAIEAARVLPPSRARDCLVALACKVLTRSS